MKGIGVQFSEWHSSLLNGEFDIPLENVWIRLWMRGKKMEEEIGYRRYFRLISSSFSFSYFLKILSWKLAQWNNSLSDGEFHLSRVHVWLKRKEKIDAADILLCRYLNDNLLTGYLPSTICSVSSDSYNVSHNLFWCPFPDNCDISLCQPCFPPPKQTLFI